MDQMQMQVVRPSLREEQILEITEIVSNVLHKSYKIY
jgi:hypothetical protein